MLTDEGEEEASKIPRGVRSSNLDSDSGDEGFSSEDESFRNTTEIVEKKIN
jgi:hypothetical protein